MKIIYNKHLPCRGYIAINICGVVFANEKYRPLVDKTKQHEAIHTSQGKELLWIFFYLWYGIEWVIRMIQYRKKKEAYYNISFEREAYANDFNMGYLENRKWYAFIGYLKSV